MAKWSFEEEVLKYKYCSPPLSLLERLVLNDFWASIVNWYPLWLAPNVITLMGYVCVWLAFANTMHSSPNLEGELQGWQYLLNGALFFMYQTLDGSDGKQARRTKSGSALGELMDHGVDAVVTALISLFVADCFGYGITSVWPWTFVIVAHVNFFLSNMTLVHSGRQTFMDLDVMEIQTIMILTLVLTGIAGGDFFERTSFPLPEALHGFKTDLWGFLPEDQAIDLTSGRMTLKTFVPLGGLAGCLVNYPVYMFGAIKPYVCTSRENRPDHIRRGVPGSGVLALLFHFALIHAYFMLAWVCVFKGSALQGAGRAQDSMRAFIAICTFGFGDLMDRVLMMRVARQQLPLVPTGLIPVIAFPIACVYDQELVAAGLGHPPAEDQARAKAQVVLMNEDRACSDEILGLANRPRTVTMATEASAGVAASAAADDAEEARAVAREENEQRWLARPKNVLVLSRAGKPIFSSGGDELALSSIFGLLQAMLAKTDERLRVVRAGSEFCMVLAVRGPLIVVIVSRTGLEPVGYLQVQLEFVYAQILMHFTLSALQDTFRRKPGYDLRDLLGNTRTEIDGITQLARESPALMLEAVECLRLPAEVRNGATAILNSVRQANLLYAVLVARDSLVTSIAPRRHPLKASDLLLLVNFVHQAKQLRVQETWTPMCLPGFNSTGFLHAYAAYVSPNICLLLLSSGESLDQFHFCSESKGVIEAKLEKLGLAAKIEAAVAERHIAPEACEAASSIHLVYRSLKVDQFFETRVANHAPLHGCTPQERHRLLGRYIRVAEQLHNYARHIDIVAPAEGDEAATSAAANEVSPRIAGAEQGQIWQQGETESVLAIVNPSHYELYASFHIYTSAAQALACATRFAAWVKSSRSDLFLQKPPTWSAPPCASHIALVMIS
ncbi:Vacuolar fusion protein MON1 homolog A, partial [Durusdinium trenchii]